MRPATINFPEPLTRGDTLPSFYLEFDVDGTAPLQIASARMQLRTKTGTLVHTWQSPTNATILITGSKGRATMAAVLTAETSRFPALPYPGLTALYDLELTLTDGSTLTPVGGSLVILDDQTRST